MFGNDILLPIGCTATAIRIDVGPRETEKGESGKGESKKNECAPSTGGRSAKKLTHYPGDVGSSVVGDRVTHYSPSRSADLALSACTPIRDCSGCAAVVVRYASARVMYTASVYR